MNASTAPMKVGDKVTVTGFETCVGTVWKLGEYSMVGRVLVNLELDGEFFGIAWFLPEEIDGDVWTTCTNGEPA